MTRIAATADVHFGADSAGTLRPHLEAVADEADLLLVAGDITRVGDVEEAAVFAADFRDLGVPTYTVLGNHDHHHDHASEIRTVVEDAGIRVLDCESAVIRTNGTSLRVVGAKGFGGGFAGACGSEFGEPEMKAFVRHTREISERLTEILESDEGSDATVTLLHYSPIEETLRGERPEIYPFLGSYLLAEAVDCGGADLVLHGHAHNGSEKGLTPGGIPVRNVAQPVIRAAYIVYDLSVTAQRASA